MGQIDREMFVIGSMNFISICSVLSSVGLSTVIFLEHSDIACINGHTCLNYVQTCIIMNRLMKLRNEAFIQDKIKINPGNIYPPPTPYYQKIIESTYILCLLILIFNWQDSRLSITPMLDSD